MKSIERLRQHKASLQQEIVMLMIQKDSLVKTMTSLNINLQEQYLL